MELRIRVLDEREPRRGKIGNPVWRYDAPCALESERFSRALQNILRIGRREMLKNELRREGDAMQPAKLA
jgi:hypothetical protein